MDERKSTHGKEFESWRKLFCSKCFPLVNDLWNFQYFPQSWISISSHLWLWSGYLQKKQEKQTLKFWKPWIRRKFFWFFLVLTRDRNNFQTKLSLSRHRNLKFNKFKIFVGNCDLKKKSNLKNSKALRFATSFLKCLNFQYEKIYLETTLKTENYYEIEDTWKYGSAVILKMFLFGTCFFEYGFLTLVVCEMFIMTAMIIINYSYLLNLNFLQ